MRLGVPRHDACLPGRWIAALACAAAVMIAFLALSPPGGTARAEAPKAGESDGRDALWRRIFQRDGVIPGLQNEAARRRAALGSLLFRDVRLSGAGDRSCSTCHQPDKGFTDGKANAEGISGRPLQRNTPHLFDLAWGQSFYWDGRAPTLEAQVHFPLTLPDEMSGDFAEMSRRLSAEPKMAAAFAEAFPVSRGISEPLIVKALADYVRSIVAPETRFDRWVSGDDAALTQQELAGFSIFVGKAGCVACHGGWRFTDDAFHDIGLPSTDPGRGALAGSDAGLPQFKTPGLRELLHTAPYMHDGSLKTLHDVVDHYAGGLTLRPSLAPNIVRDLRLDESEKEALISFLESLSSDGDAPHNN